MPRLTAYRMSTAEPVDDYGTVWTADENGRVMDATFLQAVQADILGGPRGAVEILAPEGLVTVNAADWGLYVKTW